MRSRVTPAGAWSRSSSASLRLTESARRLPTRTATRVWDMTAPVRGWDGLLDRTGLWSVFIPAVTRTQTGLDHYRCAPTVAPPMTEPTPPIAPERPLLPLLGDLAP